MTMIERVARAICATEGIDPDKRVIAGPTISMMTMDAEWSDATDVGAEWQEWVPHARAAINAMRDYTESMSRAGVEEAQRHAGARAVFQADIERGFLAMIDAALTADQGEGA